MILSDDLSTKLSDLLIDEENEDNGLSQDYSHSLITPQLEWNSAIASVQKLLEKVVKKENHLSGESRKGIVISSTSVIDNEELIYQLETIIFSPYHELQTALLPYDINSKIPSYTPSYAMTNLGLNREDIFNHEQFCLVFTSQFSCLMLKENYHGKNEKFLFSFNPEITVKAWNLLKTRLSNNCHHKISYLDKLINPFVNIYPQYQTVNLFHREMLNNLKKQTSKECKKKSQDDNSKYIYKSISLKKTPLPPYPEMELLQALTHEIRTPLTTIKTITQLLKKKTKSRDDLTKYLETIEQECTEQINRMELIFRAVELESESTKKEKVKLIPTSLEMILNQTIPHWKKQAERRNITLDVILPHELPQIVSDPSILSQILTGLMEKFTRNLPSGCHCKLLILTVGNQLKLQFFSDSNFSSSNSKCLGKLLLFQPDTGSLSLSHDVTKNIFHALGAKFTIKQKPNKGEILTIFLPLGQHG